MLVARLPGTTRSGKAAPAEEETIISQPAELLAKTVVSNTANEEEKLAQVLANDQSEWHASASTAGARGGRYKKYGSSGHVPPSYMCFRCGGNGHLISDCPTNGNPAYDTHKIKRTTGIPRNQLVNVADGTVPGAMLAADGKTWQVYKSSL